MKSFIKNAFIFVLLLSVIDKHLSSLVAIENAKNDGIVEIIYSSTELEQMGKWSNKSMDTLTKDALKGDKAGLYMLGMCFMTGSQGFTIDVEKANCFFSLSASLGFAPALDQIKGMYVEEKQDPFLAMVYLNLAASYGHSELVIPYHSLRTKVIDAFGINIVKEIEQIASKKRELIEKNIENIKSKGEDPDYVVKVLLKGSITRSDFIYTDKYWSNISRGELDNSD